MTSPVIQYDSLHKIAHYIAMLATEPFLVNGKLYRPPGSIQVSWTFWRDYTCPAGCGGCCKAFTMDYFLATDTLPSGREHKFLPNKYMINWQHHTRYSNLYSALPRYKNGACCEFLDDNGRCRIHDHSPLSCRFELVKLQYSPRRDMVWLGKKLYRNGWRYHCADGTLGAKCQMLDTTPATYAATRKRDIPLFAELLALAEQWGIKTRIAEVIEFLQDCSYKGVVNRKVWRL